jgi:DNA recombination protein RmuC
MEILLIILVIVVLALLAFNVYFLTSYVKKQQEKELLPKEDDKSFDLLLQQVNESGRTVDAKIQQIGEQMTKRLMDVTKSMTESTEASKQVFTIADQLKNLEQVLKHQKQRGNLGEASLELILSNILPPTAYTMQYRFETGEAVDAVIKTKDGLIPIDAKFSLDNYNRVTLEKDDAQRAILEKEFKNDLKKRIDETSKYIKTEEGTLPFAFMYIPAEGIYYDLLINEVGAVKTNTRNLIDYAYNDKKVIIVSPTTFAAYLQSVLYGFKAFKIEESAKEIQKNVVELEKHLRSYGEFHGKLGKTLSTVVSHYDRTNKEFNKIDKDMLKITGESMDLDLEGVDKPMLNE